MISNPALLPLCDQAEVLGLTSTLSKATKPPSDLRRNLKLARLACMDLLVEIEHFSTKQNDSEQINFSMSFYFSKNFEFNLIYSGDPKTGRVRISNGPKLVGYGMVRFSNAIRKPDNVRFSNGIRLGRFLYNYVQFGFGMVKYCAIVEYSCMI